MLLLIFENLINLSTPEFWKLLQQFVKIRSVQEGLSGFLKHVGLLFILARLKLEQKFLTDESSTPALKSPKKRSWSYLVRYRSMFLLRSAKGFHIIAFLGLYEQLSSYFFLLLRFISTKKPLFIGRSFDSMSSLRNNKIPPRFPSLSQRKGTLWPSNKIELEGNFHQVLFLIS